MFFNEQKLNLPALEERILNFWRQHQIFEKVIQRNKGKRKFIFYEGPPSSNGRPGIHHVLARIFKDIIIRYRTMLGFDAPRQAGWDTHGLPVEIAAEKDLGLKSKKDIEKYGVAAFNRKCREIVWGYQKEWEELTERIGFWLDLKNPYITYENDYIESLWWIIKQFWRRKLFYKGYKVVPWCPRCGTALSSHEVALGYKTIEENSVYLKFKLKKGQKIGRAFITTDKTYILSWTTTPWTLPGNVALAVGEQIDYKLVKHKSSGEFHILASLRLNSLPDRYSDKTEIITMFKGKDLIGLVYEPLFNISQLKNSKTYKVYPADFVTTEEGTGVVHTAVMYGEDDYELGKKFNLPQFHTVDETGCFTKAIKGLAGLFVKETATEQKIFNWLKKNNNLLEIQLYTHEYPFCWRCDTPLLYYARTAWFVAMSRLRRQLLAANKEINWVPAHIKNGRFGEWLKEVKDWNFSRERYWGTPLPVWECSQCNLIEVFGSRTEIDNRAEHNDNVYWLVRHGESLSNIKNIINSSPQDKDQYALTLKGRVGVEKLAKQFQKNKNKIDLIFSSDFRRTRETAEILAEKLKVKRIIFDERLREINVGIFHRRPINEYHQYFSSLTEKFSKKPPQGENLRELAQRVYSFIKEIDKKYKNKNIIIVSHEYPLWMLETIMMGWDQKRSVLEKEKKVGDFIKTGERHQVRFFKLPRDEYGFLDFHRPYIDEIIFRCHQCGQVMKRVKEVADVWFDSGAMPLAAVHYPFTTKQLLYPADYISEAMDQTRGWFYTLLAVAVALGKSAPYKNVISLGLIHDKKGQKMSKSRGNVVDPWQMIQRYGVDALRWYFYTINPPGDQKNFDEEEVLKTIRRFILLVYNSFIFFKTYQPKNLKEVNIKAISKNILDQWILARLNETVTAATRFLNQYDVGGAAKSIEDFGDDLSRWYIRRSRRRFQRPKNQKDWQNASQTLRFVLLNLAKLLAPFMPFFSEGLYQALKPQFESVHLEKWPTRLQIPNLNRKLLKQMAEIRHLAGLVLAKRAEAGIKVRQPLQKIKIKSSKIKIKALLDILKEEVNVKQIVFDAKLKEEVWLDTKITHRLKEEGWLRELLRIIQDLRHDAGFQPNDKVILLAELPSEAAYLVRKNENFVKREINAVGIEYRRSDKFKIEIETQLENWPIWLGLRKQT